MNYDKQSLLAGIAIGRQLVGAKGGGGVASAGGGLIVGELSMNLSGFILEYKENDIITGDVHMNLKGDILQPAYGIIVSEYLGGV